MKHISDELQKRAQFNKELMALAVPLALQRLLTALVGASDALMLGRLNQSSIAAVSLANEISFVMTLFTAGISGSAGALIAQYWGKKDMYGVRRFMGSALRYMLLIGLVFTLAGYFMPRQLMRFFTTDEEMIEIGAGYLKIVCFSYCFTALSQVYLTLMKIDGRVKLSVIISAVTVTVDMFVDFFLIYGIAGVPKLGANGSAYSTVVVEMIAFAVCVVSTHRKGRIHPNASDFTRFSLTVEGDIWKLAIPMLASALSWGLSITAHAYIIGHCGTDATAAYSVTNVAQSLTRCVTQGMAAGSGIMLGKLLGANEMEKAKDYGRRFWKVALLCGFFNMAVLCVIGPLVYAFYVLEPLAKQYLIYMLLYSMLYMFAYAFNTVFTCGVFPAGGDAKYDAVTVFIATWLIALPLSFLGLLVFHWPVMVIYMVMCADEIVKAPVLWPYYHRFVWLKNITRDSAEQQ